MTLAFSWLNCCHIHVLRLWPMRCLKTPSSKEWVSSIPGREKAGIYLKCCIPSPPYTQTLYLKCFCLNLFSCDSLFLWLGFPLCKQLSCPCYTLTVAEKSSRVLCADVLCECGNKMKQVQTFKTSETKFKRSWNKSFDVLLQVSSNVGVCWFGGYGTASLLGVWTLWCFMWFSCDRGFLRH